MPTTKMPMLRLPWWKLESLLAPRHVESWQKICCCFSNSWTTESIGFGWTWVDCVIHIQYSTSTLTTHTHVSNFCFWVFLKKNKISFDVSGRLESLRCPMPPWQATRKGLAHGHTYTQEPGEKSHHSSGVSRVRRKEATSFNREGRVLDI